MNAHACTRCHKAIVRAVTEPGGRQIILDATPVEDTQLVLDGLELTRYELDLDTVPQPVARAWRPELRTRQPDRLYACHLDTCRLRTTPVDHP